MLNFFDQDFKPTTIEDILDLPDSFEKFWEYDIDHRDYYLTPLTSVESLETGMYQFITAEGYKFWLPSSFFVLVYCEDTFSVDCIPVEKASAGGYRCVTSSLTNGARLGVVLETVDYKPACEIVIPSIRRNEIFAIPVSDSEINWMLTTPNDLHSRYFKKIEYTIGDFS
jgi:hypothetical protein